MLFAFFGLGWAEIAVLGLLCVGVTVPAIIVAIIVLMTRPAPPPGRDDEPPPEKKSSDKFTAGDRDSPPSEN